MLVLEYLASGADYTSTTMSSVFGDLGLTFTGSHLQIGTSYHGFWQADYITSEINISSAATTD
jgi:hypothetical protein